VNLEIILREFLVDVLRGRAKNSRCGVGFFFRVLPPKRASALPAFAIIGNPTEAKQQLLDWEAETRLNLKGKKVSLSLQSIPTHSTSRSVLQRKQVEPEFWTERNLATEL
jgi:hypothetical protein